MIIRIGFSLSCGFLSIILFAMNAFAATALDLEGTWITQADTGYEIRITATGRGSFTARYTNINNDNVFKGDFDSPSSLTVRQFYGDGRLYGTYNLKVLSNREIEGTLIDYTGNRGTVVWRKKAGRITAYDLNGSWITQAREGYQIRIRATSDTAFEAHYININNDNVFKGDLEFSSSSPPLTVRQFYGDGRLYGTYSLTIVSSNEITGTLVDYTGNRGTVVWRRHK